MTINILKLAPIFALGLIVSSVQADNSYIDDTLAFHNVMNETVAADVYSFNTSVPEQVVPPRAVPLTREFLVFPETAGLGRGWRSTIPVRDRSVLLSQAHLNVFESESQFSGTFFGDLLTERTFVLKDILNPGIIPEEIIDKTILAELNKISFAQERLGVLFHGYHEYKNLAFSLDIPFVAIATHPWAPSSTRKMLGEGSSDVLTEIHKTELKDLVSKIGWAVGLGDLKLGVRINNKMCGDRIFWTFGGELIVPTQSGLAPQRALSFNPVHDNFNPELYDLIDEETLFRYAKNLLSMVRALGANPRLGQKSYGFGLNAGLQLKIHSTCAGYASAQAYHTMPVKEYRIIHRYLDNTQTALAVEPGEFLIKSNPGLILRANLGFEQKMTQKLRFGLGCDVFFQGKESINKDDVSTDPENLGRLLTGAAEMGQVSQTVLYGQIIKKLAIRDGKAELSIRAAGTLHSSGIGKLWSIGVCLATTF